MGRRLRTAIAPRRCATRSSGRRNPAGARRSHPGWKSLKGVEGASLPAVDEHLEVALGIRRQRLEAAIDRALERNAIGDERLEVDLAPAQELDRRDVVVHRMG